MLTAVTGSILKGFTKPQYAELARKIQYRSHRDCRLLREVKAGDLVWGLYGGACEWLPASIEAVNEDGTFDVKYLLTETEIQAARAATTARKLLKAGINEDKEISMEPLPFDNERQLVENVFVSFIKYIFPLLISSIWVFRSRLLCLSGTQAV